MRGTSSGPASKPSGGVFFKHLGLRWGYETQGHVVDGTPYLPDFKLILPGDRIAFAEVKDDEADWHEGRHVRLCRALARETGWPVILLVGVPSYRAYHRFTPDLAENAFQAAFFRDYGVDLHRNRIAR